MTTPTTTTDRWEPADGTDVYRPVPRATELVRAYSERTDFFRLNRYAASVMTTTTYEPGSRPDRMRGRASVNGLMDGAPIEFEDTQPEKWRTARYCFPFGSAGELFPPWPSCKTAEDFDTFCQEISGRIKPEDFRHRERMHLVSPDAPEYPYHVAEIAACSAAKAMTVRALLGVRAVQTLPNIRADGNGHDQLQFAAERIAKQLRELKRDGCVELRLVVNTARARTLLGWNEKDTRNPKNEPTIFSIPLAVENAVIVETDKNTGKQKRRYAWPGDFAAVLCYDTTPTTENCNCSSLQYRFFEHECGEVDRMCVETKHGANGFQGRIVEDYAVTCNPELAFVLTW